MTTTTLILVILLWPLCLFIIGMILLQGGAGDLSSSFGGGGQLDSTLGVGAGRKMSKITGWFGGAFLLIVTMLSIHHDGDLSAAAGGQAAKAPVPMTPTDFSAHTATTTDAGKPAIPTDAAKPGVVVPPAVAKPADGAPAPAPTVPTTAPVAPATAPAIAPAVVPAAPSAPAPASEAPKAQSAPALVPEAPAAAPIAAPTPAAPTAGAPAEVKPAAPAEPTHSGVQLEPK